MLDQFWSSLKSGTDIRGVASEGGGYEINLTDDVVKRICKGCHLAGTKISDVI